MSLIEDKLNRLGFKLEAAKQPVGNYIGCKKVGNLLFVSGRVSDLIGEVGSDVTLIQAKEAARHTVLLILSIIKDNSIDLDSISGVVKLQGFIRSSSTFTDHPKVLDGASEILISLFGENGRHARTATGVAQLPFGASVQLDLIFEMAIS